MWCGVCCSQRIWWCQPDWTKPIITVTFPFWTSFRLVSKVSILMIIQIIQEKKNTWYELFMVHKCSGWGRSNTSAQVTSAYSWTKIGTIHSMGTDKYSSGIVTQQSVCSEFPSCFGSHACQSHEHLFRMYYWMSFSLLLRHFTLNVYFIHVCSCLNAFLINMINCVKEAPFWISSSVKKCSKTICRNWMNLVKWLIVWCKNMKPPLNLIISAGKVNEYWAIEVMKWNWISTIISLFSAKKPTA